MQDLAGKTAFITGGASGLGLAICQQIAKAHHGAIRAEGSALGGVKFHITLPLVGDNSV